jgi:hypothetical protein
MSAAASNIQGTVLDRLAVVGALMEARVMAGASDKARLRARAGFR